MPEPRRKATRLRSESLAHPASTHSGKSEHRGNSSPDLHTCVVRDDPLLSYFTRVAAAGMATCLLADGGGQ